MILGIFAAAALAVASSEQSHAEAELLKAAHVDGMCEFHGHWGGIEDLMAKVAPTGSPALQAAVDKEVEAGRNDTNRLTLTVEQCRALRKDAYRRVSEALGQTPPP